MKVVLQCLFGVVLAGALAFALAGDIAEAAPRRCLPMIYRSC